MNKMTLYNHLPVWVQNVACHVEGLNIKRTRYGSIFWKKLYEYETRDKWSYDQKCDYRDAKLREMVKYCYDYVPYYKKLFNEGGIDPLQIKYLDDLKKIPILTKDLIRKQPEDFISSSFPSNMIITNHTSGTTGAGFIFKTTQEAISEQWAVWWRYRRKIGIKFDSMCAVLQGKSIVPVSQEKPPFYRWIVPCRQMYHSIYHMKTENLDSYIFAIQKNNIRWIHGYPSAINLLAEHIIERRMKLKVDYVTTGAENLLDQQRENIRKAFGCEPYQHYGLSESTANFSEDIDHLMTVDEDFSAVEFLRTCKENKSYSIIGTNLTNFAMPMLRYDTGDLCMFEETKVGRIIRKIDGRNEDYLVTKDGTKIGRLDHIFKDQVNVKEAQFIQEDHGEVTLRIVKSDKFSDDDEYSIQKEINERIPNIDLKIEYVYDIPRTKSGKFRFVIQHKKSEKLT